MLSDIIAGIVIAILTGLGIGSGGLLVIYLTLFGNVPQIAAQGLNLLFFIFSAGASMIVHLQKRKIFFSLVLLLILSAIPGVFAGVFLADFLPVDLVRIIFGVMLVLSGTLTLFRKKGSQGSKNILTINKKQ